MLNCVLEASVVSASKKRKIDETKDNENDNDNENKDDKQLDNKNAEAVSKGPHKVTVLLDNKPLRIG